MSNIKIRTALAADFRELQAFISLYFYKDDPMAMFHYGKDRLMEPPDEYLRECIDNETTFMAFKDSKLVGVLVAGAITSDVVDDDFDNKDSKTADIFRFLSYIEKKADYCNRLQVLQSLHIHVLSIHPDHQRQGIASQLFTHCVETGKTKNYPAFSTDCSSYYSERIAEKFGMSCLSTTTYDEYNEHIGKQIFIGVCEPHSVIKSYAKLYNKN